MRVCERVKRVDDHISGEGEGDGGVPSHELDVSTLQFYSVIHNIQERLGYTGQGMYVIVFYINP